MKFGLFEIICLELFEIICELFVDYLFWIICQLFDCFKLWIIGALCKHSCPESESEFEQAPGSTRLPGPTPDVCGPASGPTTTE